MYDGREVAIFMINEMPTLTTVHVCCVMGTLKMYLRALVYVSECQCRRIFVYVNYSRLQAGRHT